MDVDAKAIVFSASALPTIVDAVAGYFQFT